MFLLLNFEHVIAAGIARAETKRKVLISNSGNYHFRKACLKFLLQTHKEHV